MLLRIHLVVSWPGRGFMFSPPVHSALWALPHGSVMPGSLCSRASSEPFTLFQARACPVRCPHASSSTYVWAVLSYSEPATFACNPPPVRWLLSLNRRPHDYVFTDLIACTSSTSLPKSHQLIWVCHMQAARPVHCRLVRS